MGGWGQGREGADRIPPHFEAKSVIGEFGVLGWPKQFPTTSIFLKL